MKAGLFTYHFSDNYGAQGGGDSALQRAIVKAMPVHVGAPKPMHKIKTQNIYGGTLTFNKGSRRRSKEITDPDLRAEINETLTPHLERWGYAD